jgi:hypothetical protein
MQLAIKMNFLTIDMAVCGRTSTSWSAKEKMRVSTKPDHSDKQSGNTRDRNDEEL